MAGEEEWIAATQEGLGKLIARPKMTEKYLKKPPFRFLHDIVMEVGRTTTFGNGLFTAEESDAAGLADKSAKVEFLNKAISCTCFALGEKIDVSANKIVAGLEADKTNLFLQKLHIAATTAVDKSEEAVQRVLAGESVAAPRKKKKEDEPAAPEGGDAAAPDAAAAADEEAKKAEEKKRRAEKKKRDEAKRAAEEEAAAVPAAPAPEPPAPAEGGADPEAEEGERKARKEEERRKKDEEKKQRDERKKQKAEEEQRQAQAEQEAAAQQASAQAQQDAAMQQQQQQQYEQQQQQAQQQQYAQQQQAAEEEQRRQQMMQQQQQQPQMDDMGGGGDIPSAPGSAQAQYRPVADPGMGGMQQGSPEEIAARAEAMMQGQQAGAEDGQRPERPRTAGRKPPKVTSKVKTSEDQPGSTQGVIAPTIIAEGGKDDDDEDMFEAPVQQGLGGMPVKADDGAPHGKLVQDLLKEKKAEEDKERLRKEEEETREEVEEPGQKGIKMGKLKRKNNQGAATSEIDTAKLSESIQQLCQAANPLGKSIDLVHQDISNMGKELDKWKQDYREASEQYTTELKNTDELLQPLYQKIAELDDRIGEQKSKIRNSRSRISKNDSKIQSLLESVVMAK